MTSLIDENLPVTAIISQVVKPGYEEAYEQWQQDILAAAHGFEGHAGVNIIRPHDHANPEYVVIVRFNHYRNLKTWIESDVRRYWLEQAKPLIKGSEKVQVLEGLEAWFTLPGKPPQAPPARYKMAILTSISVYLASVVVNYFFSRFLVELPGWLQSFVLISISVVLLTYVVMPRVTRLFYRWLYPKATQ